jgi:hypothetical protein
MITITCSCGRRFQTKDENAGKRTKCPICGNGLIVPALGVDTEPAEKADKPVPPSWWYPKGQPEIPKASVMPGSPSGETKTEIKAPPEVFPEQVQVTSSPDKKSNRLMIASGIGCVGLLFLGLIVWMGYPGSTPQPGPKRTPDASNLGTSPRPANPRVDQPPGERLSTVDQPPSADPPDKSKASSDLGVPKLTSAEANKARLTLLVPAYFYPAGPGLKQWEQLIEAAARVPIVAIANPASGPGERTNSDYSAVVGRAKRRGVTVIGYVGTNYAHRPIAEVEADVDRWVRFYPEISGIFFDAQEREA